MSEVRTVNGKPPVVTSPVSAVHYTWMDYITGDIVKVLQRALNNLYSGGLATDGYLGDLTIAVFDRVLVAQGQRNDLVGVIQKRLIQLGCKLSNYGADGDYGVGGETYRAVVQF